MNLEGLKISTQKPLVGSISLSGDTVSTILVIISSFFVHDSIKITNVPRSSLLIYTLDILSKIGINSKWIDIDKLSCSITDRIKTDITFIESVGGIDIGKLLIPLLLFRESKCIVNLSNIDEAKFFKRIGFVVSQLDKKIVISVPSFLPHVQKLETDLDDTVDQAARLFLNFIYQDSINIKYHDDNLAVKKTFEVKKSNDIVINTSLLEFSFYASLAVITRGECIFSNIKISEILQFLVLLERLGVRYESYNNKLKIWASDFIIESFYDFTSFEPFIVGYAMLIIFRHNHNKNVRVLVKRSHHIKEIIRDLNILGLEITSRNINDDTNFELVNLKIIKSISPIKVPVINEVTGGIIINAAASFAGNHRINDLSLFSMYYPYLSDNLAILKLGND